MNQRQMIKYMNAEFRQIKKQKKQLERVNKMVEKIKAKANYPRDEKGKRIKTTTAHLQKAKEIGGTCSVPPLATIKLLAIKIGWINSNKKDK